MRTLIIVLLLISASGCVRPFSGNSAARRHTEADGQPPSFDAMVLATIRRNAHNIKIDMSPDEVVTVLGLQALGAMEMSSREDVADYRFTGQQCRVIVQTTDTHPVRWIGVGTIVGLVGTSHFLDDRSAWIENVIFERADGTRVSFVPDEIQK